MINLVNHFTHDDSHHSEWLRQRKWFIKAREDKVQREEAEAKLEENVSSFATGIIVATELEIQAFEAKLDTYDAATVTALMENQKQLDTVNAQIEAMLAQAYVMEDGRRVFKSEDGSRVIDEHGKDVSPDELDFDLIDSNLPTAEDFEKNIDISVKLEARKNELVEYQEKLDDARERVSEGHLSAEDIEELNAELLEDMPEPVQAHVPGMEKTTPDPAPTSPNMFQEVKLQSNVSVPAITP